MPGKIVVRGAREHNLKNITVELPRDKFIVITGLSGSGKSTLAFDTIYAEGQRRYVESLTAYARQFLGLMNKPDVDAIEGLSPAISIEQKTTSKNPAAPSAPSPRSTTTSDSSTPGSASPTAPPTTFASKPRPRRRSQPASPTSTAAWSRSSPPSSGRRKAPTSSSSETSTQKATPAPASTRPSSAPTRKSPWNATRCTTSTSSSTASPPQTPPGSPKPANRHSRNPDGLLLVLDKKTRNLYSSACLPRLRTRLRRTPATHVLLQQPVRRLRNLPRPRHPHGLRPSLIIPDKTKCIADGAIALYRTAREGWRNSYLGAVAKHFGFDLFTPIEDLTEDQFNTIMYGTQERIRYNISMKNGEAHWSHQGSWEGLVPQSNASTNRPHRRTAARNSNASCASAPAPPAKVNASKKKSSPSASTTNPSTTPQPCPSNKPSSSSTTSTSPRKKRRSLN